MLNEGLKIDGSMIYGVAILVAVFIVVGGIRALRRISSRKR